MNFLCKLRRFNQLVRQNKNNKNGSKFPSLGNTVGAVCVLVCVHTVDEWQCVFTMARSLRLWFSTGAQRSAAWCVENFRPKCMSKLHKKPKKNTTIKHNRFKYIHQLKTVVKVNKE